MPEILSKDIPEMRTPFLSPVAVSSMLVKVCGVFQGCSLKIVIVYSET